MRLRLLLSALLLLASAAKADPNIIVIIADDLSIGGVSAYGTRLGAIAGDAGTPNIDALAAAGVKFTNAYADNPLCQPSRANLYTGQLWPYHHQSNNTSDTTGFWALQTLPGLLQDDSYTTALIGKSHLGPPPVGDPWDHYAVLSTDQGTYDNPTFYENSTTVTTAHNASINCVSLADFGDDANCYFSDELTKMATNWIAANKDTAGPFFLVLAAKAPHSQFIPAVRDDGALQSATPSQPATYGDARTGRSAQVVAYLKTLIPDLYSDWSSSQWDNDRPGGFGKETATPSDPSAVRKAWLAEQLQEDYLETIMALDDSVGTIRAYLAANSASGETGNLAANTVVIFVSDNGFEVADHALYGKDVPYRESVRVPLMMAGPGITAGQTKSEIVLITDLSATIADLANLSPTGLVGRTLFDLLPVTGAAWRTAALLWGSWTYDAATPDSTPWYGIVTASWMLVNHYEARGGIAPAWELIDLVNDPTELTNVYGVAANLQTRETLREQLRTLLAAAGLPGWTDTRLSSRGSSRLP